jgi:hypothetical protein
LQCLKLIAKQKIWCEPTLVEITPWRTPTLINITPWQTPTLIEVLSKRDEARRKRVEAIQASRKRREAREAELIARWMSAGNQKKVEQAALAAAQRRETAAWVAQRLAG